MPIVPGMMLGFLPEGWSQLTVVSGTVPFILSGAFLMALLGAIAGTYVVRQWAFRKGYLDLPDNLRRIHTDPTPNVGGVAVSLVATLTFILWGLAFFAEAFGTAETAAMLVGGLLMFALGFRDDVQHLPVRVKFFLQFVIASGVFLAGVRIESVNLLWTGEFSLLVSFLVTTTWIVGITNAFNLLDGSDGVAAGAALFASASMAVAFTLLGDPMGALMAVILVGACLGFLFFNFPPASIFMGDSGSLFLGYTLATLGVVTTSKATTVVAVAIPVVAFGVPLVDTTLSIIRRFLAREPILRADRGHIHHRLRDLGHSPRAVAITIYVACAGFAALSMILASRQDALVLPVLFVAAVILVVGVQRLNVPELTELTRLIGRGFQQRWVIAHNMRMKAATEALRAARDGGSVVDALELAFTQSEFARFELVLPRELGETLARADSRVVRDGDGYRLTVCFTEQPLAELIEIRIPVVSKELPVGYLSLFRSPEGERLFTDLRLFPKVLVPQLVEALEGMARPRSEASVSLVV